LLGLIAGIFSLINWGQSRGPVFYRQQHVGCMGRSFRIYRFRTMRTSSVGADRSKARANSLLIPGGGLLRASGLADLPQIVNVLRGEMSLVGPRPSPAVLDDARLTGQRNALHAVPGMTGAWRLVGENATQRDAATRWETTYPERMSLGADLRIIVRTLFALFFLRRGL